MRPSPSQLGAGLATAEQALGPDGRWRSPSPTYVCDEYLSIAAGAVLAIAQLLCLDATTVGPVQSDNYTPPASWAPMPGTITTIYEEPFVIGSGVLVNLGAASSTVLWTDAPRAPQTIPTLLIIGI